MPTQFAFLAIATEARFLDAACVGYILQMATTPSDCGHAAIARHFQPPAEMLSEKPKGANMLHYAVVFFIIALIAAVFGFGGIAVGAAGIAKILFIVFLIGAVVSFLMSMGRRA
jgi:uncharacterized membrane protein YtjA (UPF0391 family)